MKRNLLIIFIIAALLIGFSMGVVAERVPKLTIKTTTEGYDPIRYEAAFLIQENWAELGIEVDILPTEFSALIQQFYNEQDFEIAIAGWSGRVDRLDPQHFLGTLESNQADLGGNNPGGYVNERYDELFVLQSTEFDQNKRREYVQEMQEIGMRDQAVNILFYRDEVVAYNKDRFTGFVPMAGEAIYNEWIPFTVEPLGEKRVLTIGTTQEPDTINPLDSTTVWGWKFMRMYYDKLVRLSPDIEPLPWAAKSVEAIDDVTIEVVLREGMSFHDGMPLTVEDVKFTYEYYVEQDFPYFRPFYQPLDEVKIVDDDTLHFVLKEPTSFFITVTLSQIPILPKHIWEDIEVANQLSPEDIPTIGSGPMKFDVYERGEYKRMVKFDDYFKADEVDIDAIEYIVYADAEGVYTGLVTERVDMTGWRLEPAQIELARNEEHLEVVGVPDFGYYHMTYNLRIPPLDDVEYRRALAHAIPQDTFINVLLDGLGERGTSIVAPVNAFWHNPDVPTFEYDLDIAREKLEAAGYWWDDEGFLNFPQD